MSELKDTGAATAAPVSPEHAARMERARSRSVFIATPVARNPVRQYTIALLDTMLLLQQLGIKARLQWVVGNSNLARARNELVAEFLASDCTDLLFIDDDMGWKARDVVRLLSSAQAYIGGVGRKKDPTSDDKSAETWCCRTLPGELDGVIQDEMGAVEVRGVGTGFVKIAREVFESVVSAHPDLKRPGLKSMPQAVRDQFYRFFAFQDEADQQMSEDLAFCEMWRSLGGTVWADPTIELIHVGEREFSGTFAAILEAEDEVTK